MPESIRCEPIGLGAVLRLTSWSNVLADSELPAQVGATLAGPTRVLCVSPGEWLLISLEQKAATLREAFSPELLSEGAVLVDITDGIVAFEVHGAAVRDVLAQGCGLDFHPRSFVPGRCARTRFAQIAVVLDCLEETRFALYVARSHAHYLAAWLEDAASTAPAPPAL